MTADEIRELAQKEPSLTPLVWRLLLALADVMDHASRETILWAHLYRAIERVEALKP